MKMMMDEIAAGKVADFLVLYNRAGRAYRQAMFAPSEAEALVRFYRVARECGMRVSDVRVVVRPAVSK